MKNFSESIKYIGVDDTDIDLFEGQYIVPNGMAYNSFLITDKLIVVTDTVDARKVNEWLKNLEEALCKKSPDYLILHHLEPDHAGGILEFVETYPNVTIVASAKALAMLPQFVTLPNSIKTLAVKEGDTLNLGTHELQFVAAPMVHWPEVIFSYEKSEKVLFSADAFGKFGVYDADSDDWACEARRYYFNIVGKYGNQVQSVLKKASALDIKTICPLHGPVLSTNLEYYISLYDTWSRYAAETSGVFVAYASIYGHTAKAANEFAKMLKQYGVQNIAVTDIARSDLAEAVEDAFRYDRMVIMSPTYDSQIFPIVQTFLEHIKSKNYSNRIVGVVENGSWAPVAAKKIIEELSKQKNVTIANNTVTIKTSLAKDSIAALDALAKEIAASFV